MKRPRTSIASLLNLVLFVGVAVAALRASDDAWDSCVLGLALVTLTTAVLLAVHRTERRRAYWLGFALFGCVYLVASLVPSIESRFPTSKGLAYLDSKVPGRHETFTVRLGLANAAPNSAQAVTFSPDGRTLPIVQDRMVRLWDVGSGRRLAVPGGTSVNFVRIGHSLLALVMAWLGGHLSRWLYGGGSGRRGGDVIPAS